MNTDRPTLLNPHNQLGKVPSPEMQKKVKQIIRKKASLYGIQELANPLLHSNHGLLFSSRLTKQRGQSLRAKSTLQSVPSTTNIKSNKHTTRQYDQQGEEIVKAAVVPSYKLDSKTHQQKLFPPLRSLKNLVQNQKQVLYIFRDKLDYDLNDVVFEYLKILELAIAHESQIFAKVITPHKGILIPTLQFLAQSFLQCQFNKIVLVFAIIGLQMCEFYKQLDKVGKFLFIVSKVLRKMEKYQECEIVLKKALEYVWFARGRYQRSKDREQKHYEKDERHKRQKEHTEVGQYEREKDTEKNHKKTITTTISHDKPNTNQPQPKQTPTHNTQTLYASQPHNSLNHHHHSYHQHKLKLLLQQYTNTQLSIYNQLSYCLLQLNKKQESRVFGEKYQIGYLQKETTANSVMQLSRDLIASAQKRIVAWQRVDKRRLDLTLGIQLDQYLLKYGQTIKDKFQEQKFIKALKVNIDLLIDNFFKKDIFFYEVPLITEFKDNQRDLYKKSHNKLPVLTQKFVYKKKSLTETGTRASSIPANMKKFKNQNVGGNKIFNYRGVGLSRTKLTTLFRDYIRLVQWKLGHVEKELNFKLQAIMSLAKNDIGNQKNKTATIENLDTHKNQ